MTDRELLEAAAKAAGLDYIKPAEGYNGSLGLEIGSNPMRTQSWNPLTSDADALRLAVKLRMNVHLDSNMVDVDPDGISWFSEAYGTDPYAATRRAIVRAAAEIGRSKT
jgi:hypothetical protein